MTQVEAAVKGIITEEMKAVAGGEGLTPEYIMEKIAAGQV
ncbi:MAG: phosphomethylpyrimidine synthase ThiC, partial [Thermodesulfobacteriota bacterium]